MDIKSKFDTQWGNKGLNLSKVAKSGIEPFSHSILTAIKKNMSKDRMGDNDY